MLDSARLFGRKNNWTFSNESSVRSQGLFKMAQKQLMSDYAKKKEENFQFPFGEDEIFLSFLKTKCHHALEKRGGKKDR